jgi:hypothetical protein
MANSTNKIRSNMRERAIEKMRDACGCLNSSKNELLMSTGTDRSEVELNMAIVGSIQRLISDIEQVIIFSIDEEAPKKEVFQ